jgi:hypothetical protein
MNKFCTSCGAALEEGQQLCGSCGKPAQGGTAGAPPDASAPITTFSTNKVPGFVNAALAMKPQKHALFIICGIAVLAIITALVLAGHYMERKFVLEKIEDYFTYSEVPFKSAGYNNTRLLRDSSDYNIVLKELRQIFGHEGTSRNSFEHGPKSYQAELGFFKDKDNGGRLDIILEVGSDIKSGGKSWNWNNITDSDFEKGKFVLKLRLSDLEYKVKLLGL